MSSYSIFADAKFHIRQFYGKINRRLIPKPIPSGHPLRLPLGCGAIDHPGFVNIDGIDRPHVHFVQSLTKLTRFQDGTVEFIYTSHTLEHFPRVQTISILKDWCRVLRPGGQLCVSVPDLDRILDIYRMTNFDADAILPPLFGGQDYPFNFHHTTFNRASLARALLEAGFSSVASWAHGRDGFHDLPDWSGRSIRINGQLVPISLNSQAIK